MKISSANRFSTNGGTNPAENRIYTNTVFQGLGYADTRASNPDTMGAAGVNYFCELLNGLPNTSDPAFAVYSKSGSNPARTNLNAFFAVSADGTNYPTGDGSMTDPRILYDSQSQCFVATAIDYNSKQVILALCTNENNVTNISGGWTRYVLHVLQSGTSFTDFDTLAFDANGVYLSVLEGNSTHSIVAIKKPDIYQGTRTAVYLTNAISNADSNLVTLQPAVNFDSVSTNGYAWFVAKGPATLTGTYQGGAIYYRRLQWSGTNAAWADTNWFTVSSSTTYQDYYDLDSTNGGVSGLSAPQSNGVVCLFKAGSDLAAPVIRNGFLWTCHTVGLDSNGSYTGDSSGTGVTRSAMQWLKLQISSDSSSLTLVDHGRVFDSSSSNNPWWYYFPSLMVNCAGDMVAGFSGSTATNYMSAFYSWRVSSGFSNAPTIVQAGAYKTISRAGDYSATTLDPTDDWTFWTVQQYGTNLSNITAWGTAITKVRPNP